MADIQGIELNRINFRRLVVSWVAISMVSTMSGSWAQSMAHSSDFSVSPNGAASYTIPIQLPAGISGVQPNLALTYSSQASNGHVGVGWSLSGLSAITRCSSSWVQDGARGGVAYTAADRFCLDGKRLMQKRASASDTSAYGDSGTTYHTEMESFTKVVATGEAGILGPKSFTVKTKDGMTLEYGGTDGSRIQVVGAPQTVYRVWALNKVRDKFGNYYSIEYVKDTVASVFNGGFYPSKISYTGNDGGATVVSPQVTVDFGYTYDRSDVTRWYQGGYLVTERGRLNSIKVSTADGVLYQYSLSYETGAQTGRTRLTSVQQCDEAKVTCLPAIQMKFEGTSTSLAIDKKNTTADTKLLNHGLPSQSYTIKDGAEWVSADFSGNGLVDLVHLTAATDNPKKGALQYWKSDGKGGFAISRVDFDYGLSFQPYVDNTNNANAYWNNYYHSLSAADVDWDGIPDLIVGGAQFVAQKYQAGYSRKWDYQNQMSFSYLSGGLFGTSQNISTAHKQSGFFPDVTVTPPMYLIMDIAGSGRFGQVKVFPQTTGSIISYAGSLMFGGTESRSGRDASGNTGKWFTFDLNGDQITDVVHLLDSSYYVWKNLGRQASGTSQQYVISSKTSYAGLLSGNWLQVDLNGDGLVDLVHVPATGAGTKLNVWISKGDGSFDVTSVANASDPYALSAGTWQVIDYNGDGFYDLLHLADGAGGKGYIWQSTGNGGFTNVVLDGSVSSDKNLAQGRWKSAALRGDGVIDLVHLLDDSGNYAVWSMPRWAGDVPTSIQNGLGGSVSFTLSHFAPMLAAADGAKGGRYLRDTPTKNGTSGLTTIVPSFKVVTQVKQTDGLGGQRSFGYNYENARIQPATRGYLGFEVVETVDVDTGLTSRVKYKQVFPFTGLVDSTSKGKTQAKPNDLQTVVNQYGCFAPTASTGVPLTTTAECLDMSAYMGDGSARFYPYLKQTDTKSWDLDGSILPPVKLTLSAFNSYGKATKVERQILSADGLNSVTDYKLTTDLVYYNSESDWLFEKLLKKTETATGPDIPALVVPGTP